MMPFQRERITMPRGRSAGTKSASYCTALQCSGRHVLVLRRAGRLTALGAARGGGRRRPAWYRQRVEHWYTVVSTWISAAAATRTLPCPTALDTCIPWQIIQQAMAVVLLALPRQPLDAPWAAAERNALVASLENLLRSTLIGLPPRVVEVQRPAQAKAQLPSKRRHSLSQYRLCTHINSCHLCRSLGDLCFCHTPFVPRAFFATPGFTPLQAFEARQSSPSGKARGRFSRHRRMVQAQISGRIDSTCRSSRTKAFARSLFLHIGAVSIDA
eukprot:6207478-Pleurochrysis_carterae.AAC.2